jgi:hypothetical protein
MRAPKLTLSPSTTPTLKSSVNPSNVMPPTSALDAAIWECTILALGMLVQVITFNLDHPGDSISLVTLENLPWDLDINKSDDAWTASSFQSNDKGTLKVNTFSSCGGQRKLVD